MSWISRRGMVAGLLGGVLCATTTAATAGAGQEATAAAHIGSVDVVMGSEPVVQDPIAPCAVPGPPAGSSGTVTVDDVASFRGGGSTECRRDSDGNASASAAGRSFLTTVLQEWGGPRISMSSYSVRCATTGDGSAGSMQLRGIRGIDVPSDIPPNYTVTIPGRIEGSAPLAKVVVNEFITPQPADGSMTMRVMRIELFPEGGGPNSGDIIVGEASCDPFGG